MLKRVLQRQKGRGGTGWAAARKVEVGRENGNGEKDEEGKEPWVLVLGPQPAPGVPFLPGPINHEAGPGDVKSFLLQSSVLSALECPWHGLAVPASSPPLSSFPIPKCHCHTVRIADFLAVRCCLLFDQFACI